MGGPTSHTLVNRRDRRRRHFAGPTRCAFDDGGAICPFPADVLGVRVRPDRWRCGYVYGRSHGSTFLRIVVVVVSVAVKRTAMADRPLSRRRWTAIAAAGLWKRRARDRRPIETVVRRALRSGRVPSIRNGRGGYIFVFRYTRAPKYCFGKYNCDGCTVARLWRFFFFFLNRTGITSKQMIRRTLVVDLVYSLDFKCEILACIYFWQYKRRVGLTLDLPFCNWTAKKLYIISCGNVVCFSVIENTKRAFSARHNKRVYM